MTDDIKDNTLRAVASALRPENVEYHVSQAFNRILAETMGTALKRYLTDSLQNLLRGMLIHTVRDAMVKHAEDWLKSDDFQTQVRQTLEKLPVEQMILQEFSANSSKVVGKMMESVAHEGKIITKALMKNASKQLLERLEAIEKE